MEYTRACRVANLWPDVIADLIGGYAEYTLEERLDLIIDEPAHRTTVMFGSHTGYRIEHINEDYPGLLAVHAGRESTWIDKANLIRSMLAREWLLFGVIRPMPMWPDELEMVDALLANIRAGGNGNLRGPFTPLLPFSTSKT